MGVTEVGKTNLEDKEKNIDSPGNGHRNSRGEEIAKRALADPNKNPTQEIAEHVIDWMYSIDRNRRQDFRGMMHLVKVP